MGSRTFTFEGSSSEVKRHISFTGNRGKSFPKAPRWRTGARKMGMFHSVHGVREPTSALPALMFLGPFSSLPAAPMMPQLSRKADKW